MSSFAGCLLPLEFFFDLEVANILAKLFGLLSNDLRNCSKKVPGDCYKIDFLLPEPGPARQT